MRKTIQTVVDLDDFTGNELITELESRDYNFTAEVTDEEMIETLEGLGFTVTYGNSQEISKYDLVDSLLLTDIQEKFESLDWEGRQRMRDLIINFK